MTEYRDGPRIKELHAIIDALQTNNREQGRISEEQRLYSRTLEDKKMLVTKADDRGTKIFLET